MNALSNAGETSAAPPVETVISDLTSLCLPDHSGDSVRICSWTSAVSGFLLIVGTFGFFRKPLEFVLRGPAEPELVPVLIEPQVQPPTPTETQQAEPEASSEPSPESAPTVTVVAATASEVAFAVPVVGDTIIGPARLASAPPINNVAISKPVAPPAIVVFTGEENRSDYPYPPYPLEARKRGMSGKILFLAEVDASGSCTKIEIKQSCGHSFLDSYSSDWIRRRWVWPPGPVRKFEIPLTFALDRR